MGTITREHAEMTGLAQEVLSTVAEPDEIFAGDAGELLAVREFELSRWIVAVYRETEHDGFVITAFFTRRRSWLDRRRSTWH